MKTFYTEEQINSVFNETGPSAMYDKEPVKNQKPKAEEPKQEEKWVEDLFEQVRNDVAEILDGVFGPQFEGKVPSRKKIIMIVTEAAEAAFPEDWD